jgi:hypothetical protein
MISPKESRSAGAGKALKVAGIEEEMINRLFVILISFLYSSESTLKAVWVSIR